jgi:flagellar hook-associated protein 3 FlgL
MRVNGGSDFARLQALQKHAFATRNRLDVAAQEMTSNLKADRFEATGGNLTRLFALERSLERNAVFSQTIALTDLRLDVMQESLGRILAPAEDLAIDLATAVGKGDYSAAMLHADAARRALTDTVAVMNTTVAGQSLFAGATTDGPALAEAEAIVAAETKALLDELRAAAAGVAGEARDLARYLAAADAIAAIEAYFAKPAGAFYAGGYVGSTTDLTPVDIGEGQRLDYGMRADNDGIVAVLRAQAMAAVVAGGAFAGNQPEQIALLAESAAQMLPAKEGVLKLRAGVGSLQEAVEHARAERVAERDTLDLARAKIVATDPLEAASAYQALEVQLEAIYTVTSRLAGLRFANFMR